MIGLTLVEPRSPATNAAAVASRPKASAELDHLYCCDEMTSLCGLDISDLPEVTHMPNLCKVCADLDEYDCRECGA